MWGKKIEDLKKDVELNSPENPNNLNNSFFSDFLIDQLDKLQEGKEMSGNNKRRVKDLKYLVEKIGTLNIDEPQLLQEIFAVVWGRLIF